MTADVLWRLSRPTVGLAAFAAGAVFLALFVVRLIEPGTQSAGLLNGIASILAGGALIAGLIALLEFFLAARAFVQWTAGGGDRCPDCDWPMSPSMVLPDRCTNPVKHK
ncbi:hypothetical protein M0534_01185 [Methylonatrum kenyense]|uniref:hypothetical protein n=1 Tax=Methylonatrum kenyense TaxID=455253 RepID=UPI0020BEDD2C|nr:hypothetical protein [Methylonatrum kenyense]MCK8514945.1 hypothetical protein [Methylonatrum kenyense]